MLLADIFRSKPVAAPVQPNPAVPGANEGNPTVPGQQPVDPSKDPNKSPLAKYDDLFKTDPNAKPTPDASMIPAFNIDPAKLMADSKNLNFTAHIDPVVIDKALAGDREAFLSVINQAGQLGFVQAASATAEITKQSFTTAQDALKGQVLPDALRSDAVNQAMANEKVFANPAIAPMMDSVKTALMKKYPTASAVEITGMAKEYVSGMAMEVARANGQTITDPSKNSRGEAITRTETDWGKYFGIA